MASLDLSGKRFALAVGVAAAALVAWQVSLIGDFRVDDAYITFAFSKNLARGRGLIFSHDVRVEGYTNFLWAVINALPIGLMPGRDPLQVARVLCFAAYGGLLFVTWRLARMFAGPVAAAAAVLLLAGWTDLTRAALSGLETIPHAMLVGLGACAYTRELNGERRSSLWWFTLAALMRISGMVTLAFVVAFELMVRVLDRKLDLRGLLRWAGPPLLTFGVYFAWRWWYYELPLPTTYYAKTLVDANDPDRAVRYIWDSMRDLGGLPMLALAMLHVARGFERRSAFLFAAVLFEAAYILRVGADWMPFHRFWMPIAALALALVAGGLSELWKATRGATLPTRAGAGLLALASVAWVFVHVDSHRVNTPQEREKLRVAKEVQSHTRDDLYASRAFLRAIIRRPGDVLATDYGGFFGFYSEASVIEMWGLCNRDIALLGDIKGINPIYGKTCIECYKKFDPDYFHVMTPLVRADSAFKNHRAVINEVFQGPEIDAVIHLKKRYASGRVRDVARGLALFFIEKRKDGNALVPRKASDGLVVDYPFEPYGVSVPDGPIAGQ